MHLGVNYKIRILLDVPWISKPEFCWMCHESQSMNSDPCIMRILQSPLLYASPNFTWDSTKAVETICTESQSRKPRVQYTESWQNLVLVNTLGLSKVRHPRVSMYHEIPLAFTAQNSSTHKFCSVQVLSSQCTPAPSFFTFFQSSSHLRWSVLTQPRLTS